MEKRKWVALFSRSGSELVHICNHFNRWPDVVICNKNMFELDEVINKDILTKPERVCYTKSKPTASDYINLIEGGDPLVTLHGWLRIVPPEICDRYEIYNLHPGNIEQYPELKGKDPQLKAYELKHTDIGCVIHRCEPELDSGEIVKSSVVKIQKGLPFGSYDTTLRQVARNIWFEFFQDQFYGKEDEE